MQTPLTPMICLRTALSVTTGRVLRQPRSSGLHHRLNFTSTSRHLKTISSHPQRRAGIYLKWFTHSIHTQQIRLQTEGEDACSSDSKKEHVHQILTFTPEMISVLGQGMVDFSTSRWIYAGKTPKWVVFSYPTDPPGKKDNFPPDSRGYLYYQKPLPSENLLAGGLQFRVIPPSKLSFDEGKDLLHKDGLPWRVPLYNIVHFKAYAPILEALVLEGTVTEDLVAHVKQMPVRRFSRRSAILYASSDTFVADLSRWPRFVHLIMPGSVITIDSFISRVFYCKSNGTNPYHGRLRLRLERSTLPQHTDSYHATVRVVEILEPVTCVVSGENFEIAEPIEGELLRRRSSLGTEYKTYTCKLSEAPNDILHKFFNVHT